MISDWVTNYRLRVIPCEERPDAPQGELVYRVKDIFTTRDGSWDPSDKPGSVTQWARERYLRPLSAPDYFDDAGGDHHLFARVLDPNGAPLKSQGLVRYWSDGLPKLGDALYNGYIRMTPKERSGWANLVNFNHFSPERNEQGPWCWSPEGAADVVVGGGMPNNLHVSFFVVWQAERRQSIGDDGGILPLEEIRRLVWERLPRLLNPDSAFAAYARTHNLGAPLTDEFDLAGGRAQGFAQGILFVKRGEGEPVQQMGW